MKQQIFLIFIVVIFFWQFPVIAQNKITTVEIQDDDVMISAKENIYLSSGNSGKVYYNGEEISILSDSIIETPFHPLTLKYINLQTTERKDGVENGIPYSDFLIVKHRAVRDGSQWCARLEYCIGMYLDNHWPGWDGKVISNNRYSVYQAYKSGQNSSVILDIENEKLYLRLYGAGEGATFTSFRVEFSYFNFQ